jgi:hypothetical protein
MIPVLVLSDLQVSKASHYSQRSGTAGNTFETCGTNFKEEASKSVPVGLTPDRNQERPEAIHARDSCSGTEGPT